MTDTAQYPMLKQVFGHGEFRDGQRQMVDAIISGRDALGIMPTGAGKSICYQLPALMLQGITLVISPLISLMIDQVMALKQMGVAAAYINSSLSPSQIEIATQRAALGYYKIIYVAPERLEAPDFIAFARDADIAMVTVDEAHCVSKWGQDFRPSYLRIPEFLQVLKRRPILSAFTATATQRVRQDILAQLCLQRPELVTTGFDRPNLFFWVQQPKDKFDALTEFLDNKSELSGIVYCATRKAVEQVTERLNENGYSAARYHAGLSDKERMKSQDDFQYDRVRIIVATNAFGMGIDKSNVSFVVHYNMPQDIESYYQEAGRAGRDGEPADCLLLYNKQDVMTARFLISHSTENPELSREDELLLIERNMDRLKQMTFYSTTKKCLRKFILNYFGDSAPERCGHCSTCMGLPYEVGEKKRTAKERNKKSAPPVGVDERDIPLYDALAGLRLSIAQQAKVPAYVIFSNATLRDMTKRKPQTDTEMLGVSGVGELKLQQYGKIFMAVIKQFS